MPVKLYEILKASKTGIAPDMWTTLAGKNWGGTDSGYEVKERTGIPPLSFRANGQPLLDYTIYGNTVQNGTPTPDSPITPQGTGDLETVGVKAGQYKIPISSANITTPVYLGEVETTRQIKKIVFTGQEAIDTVNVNGVDLFRVPTDYTRDKIQKAANLSMICNAYPIATNRGTCASTNNTMSTFNATNDMRIVIHNDTYTTADDFKAYLQQLYSANTPVIVWYILATPQTAVVNEPLRKIGDYTDTLSMEQAGVSIPTLNGQTVIDVDTTLKPSEVYIKYQG
jgi:hypothetical protein